MLGQAYRNPLALGLASGALFVVANRVPGAWAVSFIALVPVLYAIERAGSKRQAFGAGFLAGVPLMGAAMWWLFDALPLPPAFGDIPPALGLATVGISFCILALAFGAVVGAWALFAYGIRTWRYAFLAIAPSWLAFEYLRMVVYNLFTLAPHVYNPPFFSSGFIGYPLADNVSWLQLASFGGVYALGAAAAAGNMLAYRVLSLADNRRRTILGALMVAAVFLVAVLPVASFLDALRSETPRHTITVAALSLRTPADANPVVRAPAEATMLEFVRKASDAGADVVALPEESNFLAPFSSRTPNGILGDRHRLTIIDSGTALLPDGTRVRRAQAPDTLGMDSGLEQDKRILTPKGEYLPTLLSYIITAAGGGKYLDHFAARRSYSIAHGGTPGVVRGVRISVLLCIEAMVPGLGRDMARQQKSDVIALLASHAWFGFSPTLAEDTFRQARVQAVEAGVPIIRSADFAPAYVFDRYGRIVASAGYGAEPGLAVATLSIP